MSEEQDILDLIDELIEKIEEEENVMYICDDCSISDSTVKGQKSKTKENQRDLYLCSHCSIKRKEEAEKVLKDLENLAVEVEERLQAIENTERELDQWRDEQLQKNRDFWDEYRRQVENFSACRIRTLQYEYEIKQNQTENILKRLRKAKYLSENLPKLSSNENNLFSNGLMNLIQSEEFQLFLLKNHEDSYSIEDKQEFIDYIQQLSCLDQFVFSDEIFE